MGIKVIPVSGWSAKEPSSELSKCQVIKPPMCKAFQATPPRATPCTRPVPGAHHHPPSSHPVRRASRCHRMAWQSPSPLSSPAPLPWVCLSVCSDGELAGQAGHQFCISCWAQHAVVAHQNELNVCSELSPALFPSNFHFLGGEMMTFALSCRGGKTAEWLPAPGLGSNRYAWALTSKPLCFLAV